MQPNFNNNSFQQPPTFQSLSTSDVFNINSLGLPGANHYGSSPNLGPQVQTYSFPQPASMALDLNDPNLQQQVESIIASLSEQKRPMLRRQVITVPAQCQGRVATLTRRLPTPAPDIIERITVIKPPRDIVNLCIEKPTQPEPCFQSREICGKARKPLIQPRVVSVAPRSNPCNPPPQPSCCPQQQQVQQQQPSQSQYQLAYQHSQSYALPHSHTQQQQPGQYLTSQSYASPQQAQQQPQQVQVQQYNPQSSQYMQQQPQANSAQHYGQPMHRHGF